MYVCTCVDVRQREREKERGIHLAGERTTRPRLQKEGEPISAWTNISSSGRSSTLATVVVK